MAYNARARKTTIGYRDLTDAASHADDRNSIGQDLSETEGDNAHDDRNSGSDEDFSGSHDQLRSAVEPQPRVTAETQSSQTSAEKNDAEAQGRQEANR